MNYIEPEQKNGVYYMLHTILGIKSPSYQEEECFIIQEEKLVGMTLFNIELSGQELYIQE
jgi:hypothetical protein